MFFFGVLANGPIRMIGTQRAQWWGGVRRWEWYGMWALRWKSCHGSGLGFHPVGEWIIYSCVLGNAGFSCDNRHLMTVSYPNGVLCNDRSGFYHWLQEGAKDTAWCSAQSPALPSLACDFFSDSQWWGLLSTIRHGVCISDVQEAGRGRVKDSCHPVSLFVRKQLLSHNPIQQASTNICLVWTRFCDRSWPKGCL